MQILRPTEAVMRMQNAMYIICANRPESVSEMTEQLKEMGVKEKHYSIQDRKAQDFG